MQQRTDTSPAVNSPTAYAWCAWHKAFAEGVRLISAHEQGSGPGYNLFACPPCRELYRLTPYADQP